jgi:hypothetical protein
MIKRPQVSGLILCDNPRIETAPPQFALEGLFLAREYASFPTPIQSLTAYACFFDGRGEGEMRLTCTRLENEEDIYYHSRWYVFPARLPMLHYILPVRKLIFPQPGRYAFTLTFDGEPLTVRYLDVKEASR